MSLNSLSRGESSPDQQVTYIRLTATIPPIEFHGIPAAPFGEDPLPVTVPIFPGKPAVLPHKGEGVCRQNFTPNVGVVVGGVPSRKDRSEERRVGKESIGEG